VPIAVGQFRRLGREPFRHSSRSVAECSAMCAGIIDRGMQATRASCRPRTMLIHEALAGRSGPAALFRPLAANTTAQRSLAPQILGAVADRPRPVNRRKLRETKR
jgi:hypothetical protein